MKEEEDMESMKNGVTPQLPWAEGKAWGDRQSGSGREGGQQQESISEKKEGKRKREGEVRREKTEHLAGLTTESARPSEGREEFRGAV